MAIDSDRPTSGGERPNALFYFVIKVYAVAANTFVEAVRQPSFAIIVASAVSLIVISPYITMFTLLQSEKLVTDMGLATIMLAGLLLAAFSASSVISQEIENRTVLTVVSKPVGRCEFILGKFLGVAFGLCVATYLLTVALALTSGGGTMESQIERELSPAMATSIFGSMFLAVCYGLYSNFFNDKPFASRAVGASIPLFTISALIFCFVDPRAKQIGFGAFGASIDPQVLMACVLLLWSILMLASVAVAISTRLTVVVNISICLGVFLLGLLSDYFLRGRQDVPALKALYHLIPNLQVFWVADWLTAGAKIPVAQLGYTGAYALCHMVAFLLLAMLLFQERQVA